MKRQTLRFKHASYPDMFSMLDQLPIDIGDSEFVTYLQNLHETVNINYEWDYDTGELVVIRIWNRNADYDEYMQTWLAARNESEQRLRDLGYELTEAVEDL